MTEHCGRCKTALVVRCPCNRPECSVETPVPHCPKCEKAKLQAWEKRSPTGIKVCVVYVNRQMGLKE